MGKLERLEAALLAGAKMRATQRMFFKTKDRKYLEDSKAQEREFDKLVTAALESDDLLDRGTS